MKDLRGFVGWGIFFLFKPRPRGAPGGAANPPRNGSPGGGGGPPGGGGGGGGGAIPPGGGGGGGGGIINPEGKDTGPPGAPGGGGGPPGTGGQTVLCNKTQKVIKLTLARQNIYCRSRKIF